MLSTLLLLSSVAFAATSPGPAAPIVDAEARFAADAARDGIKPAFLKHLDEHSWVFVPDAASGHDTWLKAPESKTKLEWGADTAAIARSGDFGYDFGPWRATAGEKPPVFGHFFSVWKRNAAGEWHNVVDHGIGHGEVAFPVKAVRDLSASKPNGKSLYPESLDGRRHALEQADDALRAALKTRASKDALLENAERDIWIFRDDHTPSSGKDAQTLLATDPVGFGSAERRALDIAASGDYGYTLGGDKATPSAGADTRVWFFRDGRWRVVADVVTAIETPKP